MVRLVVCIAVIALGVADAKCLLGLPTQTKTNSECGWYNDKCCCGKLTSTQKVQDLQDAIQRYNDESTCGGKYGDYPQGCQDMMTLWDCGSLCSPYQDAFFDGNGGTVCSDFANRLWAACQSVGYQADGEDTCDGTNAEHYDGASHFFDDFDWDVESDNPKPDANCFNAAPASTRAPTAAVATLAALATALVALAA